MSIHRLDKEAREPGVTTAKSTEPLWIPIAIGVVALALFWGWISTELDVPLPDPITQPPPAILPPGTPLPLPPITLPPDPGAAGRATLEGIDADQDGVRDDVQIWIAYSYPKSLKMRMALRQKAMSYQQYIRDATDPKLTAQHAKALDRASDCLSYITPDFYSIARKLEALILNTSQRLHAVHTADHQMSGSMFTISDLGSKACAFDPDALPN